MPRQKVEESLEVLDGFWPFPVHATLIGAGVDPVNASRSAVARGLTDDFAMLWAVNELDASLFRPQSAGGKLIFR